MNVPLGVVAFALPQLTELYAFCTVIFHASTMDDPPQTTVVLSITSTVLPRPKSLAPPAGTLPPTFVILVLA